MSHTTILPETVQDQQVRTLPQWHVILHDDDQHTYEYVVIMLMQIFHHDLDTAFAMAVEVDQTGRVIVDTTSKERAELKREQIHTFGADPRIPRCQGSMRASIEPAS